MPHKFYNPAESLQVHEKHLPHWGQDGASYFVTSRLADSMPQEKLRQWEQDRQGWLPDPGIKNVEQIKTLNEEAQHEFHQRFTTLWHQWLDNGYGDCWLKHAEVRGLLVDAFVQRHGVMYELDAWVIMPNHFHAVVSLHPGSSLGVVLKHWKGGSARVINRAVGRTSSLWQAEPFDHIVRSDLQLRHYRRYMAQNPVLARLRTDEYSVGMGTVTAASAEALLASLPAGVE